MNTQSQTTEQNTEQIILEAAEAEFLEKGYGNAKVLSIAKRAGVSHSMLHYYFRSKEKLFQMVFESKVQKLSGMFQDIFTQQLPFEQTIRRFIESQFDFLAQNPRLPHFMITEIMSNKENRELLFSILSPKIGMVINQLQILIDQEIKKGAIRHIALMDLLLNIMSINAFTFISMPIVVDVLPTNLNYEQLLDARKESNVEFVLNSLRP